MSMTPPPYLTTVKNVPDIFAKIKRAGTPPKFNVEFLKSSLGFASSSDRGIVPQLKFLKFIDENNVPTERYNQFHGSNGDQVLAQAIKEAYAEVFLANQNANELGDKELKELFASLTGKGDAVAQKMATTFKCLCSLANFNGTDIPLPGTSPAAAVQEELSLPDPTTPSANDTNVPRTSQSSLTLRHDVHIHLPATSDVSVYKAIFRAVNEELAD